MGRATANLCACAAATAAIVLLGACGEGERRDADAPDGTYPAAVQRASFPARQRLGHAETLVISVRNTGEQAIPNLTVTVRGFRDPSGGSHDANLGRDLWIVDDAPGAAMTAFRDTWTAGRVEPGATATLRWTVTPVVAGSHRVRYSVAPALTGEARVQVADGPPTGEFRVRVSDEPVRARVDPATGEVRREE